MSLRSRIERLEATRATRGRQRRVEFVWMNAHTPESLLVDGIDHPRLNGEDNEAMLNRIEKLHPELELVVVKWQGPTKA
jgi:hypothetical protein